MIATRHSAGAARSLRRRATLHHCFASRPPPLRDAHRGVRALHRLAGPAVASSSSSALLQHRPPRDANVPRSSPSGAVIGAVRTLTAPPTPTADGSFSKVAFIGAGKMAQAMISPLITTNLQRPSSISLFDVSTKVMSDISTTFPGVQTTQSIPDAITDAELIILAVKPQNLSKVYSEIRRARHLTQTDPKSGVRLREDATVLSVIAGKPIASYLDGTGLAKVARSMPNTPAQIGRGMTVWSCTSEITADERDRIKQVLCSFGKAIFVEDESFIDMSTSISGSGPAYIFLLMESMIDAGVHMGFSRDTATALVHHTLLGSTLYAMETGEHPAILRNSVTSPAGTTASAIYELEKGRFRTVIKDAIWACYRRSLEMGGHDSNVGPGRSELPNVSAEQPSVGQLSDLLAAQSNFIKGASHHPKEAPSGEMLDGNGAGNGDGGGKA